MGKKTKLAIFDLDGTLFDTREVNYHAYASAIERCGYHAGVDHDAFCESCNGKHYQEFLPWIIPSISASGMENIHEEKKRLYASCLKYAIKNEWLFDLIKSIRGEYATAIVTTASRRNARELLDEFGAMPLFDAMIAQEDVANCKPDPEGFLLAMGQFGISAARTVIFEDSDSGIAAAEATGAGVVRVYGYH